MPVTEMLADLQWFQDQHDKLFHKDIYKKPVNEQIRHITHHVSKIAGILSDFCDKIEHDSEKEAKQAELVLQEIKDRRCPDLLIMALMLANRLEIDLRGAYFCRIEQGERDRVK